MDFLILGFPVGDTSSAYLLSTAKPFEMTPFPEQYLTLQTPYEVWKNYMHEM